MNWSFIFKYIYREISFKLSYSLQIVLAVAIGVGTITGIQSYKSSFQNAIYNESKSIMGGDLNLESNFPITEEQYSLIHKTLPEGSKYSLNLIFSSIVYSIEADEFSLSTIKALGDNYPFYSEVSTEPKDAYSTLTDNDILLSETLSHFLQASIGKEVKLGNTFFNVKGIIKKETGLAGGFLSMAPTSVIKKSAIESTDLISKGSRVRYNIIVKLPEDINSMEFKEKNFNEFIKHDLTIFHNTEVGSGSQRFIKSTLDYMSILAILSFFVGSICIMIASRTKIQEKSTEIAVLKSLGADYKFYTVLFVFELFILSCIGASFGLIIGYFIQFLIPNMASNSDLLVKVQPTLSISSLFSGIAIGIVVPMITCLESIVKIVRLSPLLAINQNMNEKIKLKFIPEPFLVLETILIYTLFVGIAYIETKSWIKSGILSGVLICIPLLLYILFTVLRFISKAFLKIKSIPNLLRLSLCMISETGGHLSLSITGIGSALTMIIITFMIQNSLLNMSGANRLVKTPNVFVLDIKEDQLESFNSITEQNLAEKKLVSKMIGARLAEINDKPISKELAEMDATKRDWRSQARIREYFLSYRENLYESENLLKGKFWEGTGEEEISIEEQFANTLGVKIGDTLTFNVQGIFVKGKITNTRSVVWSDLKPNFVVIFSPGILKNAPGNYISSFLIEENEKRFSLQKKLVKTFPNITVIDAEVMMKSFLIIINQIASIIEIMTLFLIIASVLLFISTIYSGKNQKEKEFSLFSILGAANVTIRKMILFEGLMVGVYSYLSALILGVVGNFIISKYLLNVQFQIPAMSLFYVIVATIVGTITVYLFNYWNIGKK